MDAKLLIAKLPLLSGKLPDIQREMGAQNYEQAGQLLNNTLLNMSYHGLRDYYSALLHNGPSLVVSIDQLGAQIERKSNEETSQLLDRIKLFIAQATLPDGSAS